MSGDVTIPADVAKQFAALLRSDAASLPGDDAERFADLLDPKPPTLREQIRNLIDAEDDELPNAVLAVIAEAPIEWVLATFGPRLSDWLEAQPRTPLYAIDLRHAERNQRDHDVRLLRGGSDG